MPIKPILFNTEMVRAMLDGKKSCTRRIVKGFIPNDAVWGYTAFTPKGCISCRGTFADGYGEKFFKLPYQPGDILYVRETWSEWTDGYLYKAWNSPFPQAGQSSVMRWHPSIHMPKEAARIWLEVSNVRVERLQEMKPVNVIKEGAYPDCWDCLNTYGESGSQCCYGTEEQCSQCDEMMMEWEKLWTSTIKKSDLDRYGWDADPWVWVIEFERCKKTGQSHRKENRQ